jgi:RHH-type rel operon transcriptional repressor/antitoxin RelB
MEAHLESELEKTAKLRGITKSQFIIEAVERALGRKDPYQLLLKVREQSRIYGVSTDEITDNNRSISERLREKLSSEHLQKSNEWLAFQAEKKNSI